MMPRSLQGRVTSIGVMTLAIVLGLGALATLKSLEAGVRSDLNAQNEEVLDGLAESIGGGVGIEVLLLPSGSDGTAFLIVDSSGTVRNASTNSSSSGNNATVLIDASETQPDELSLEELSELTGVSIEELEAAEQIETAPHDSNEWFETQRTVNSPNDGQLTLVALSPFGVVNRTLNRLALALSLIVPVLVLLGGAALWLALGRALRPVKQITDEANRIAPSTSAERLPVPDSGDEIAELAVTLNSMLDRLDSGLVRQRQFVSDASHELRSPLTAVKGWVEIVSSASDLPSDVRPSANALTNGVARLEAVLDDLTQLSEDGIVAQRSEVDLADLIAEEVALVEINGSVDVDLSAVSPIVVRIHPIQVRRAVHNLVSNAARHAVSQVTISAQALGNYTEITVDDDGSGVPIADRTRIFDRFVRLDQGRVRAKGGSGLGLAIVKSIAESHGGDVTCMASPSGGARFVLRV